MCESQLNEQRTNLKKSTVFQPDYPFDFSCFTIKFNFKFTRNLLKTCFGMSHAIISLFCSII